MTSGVPWNVKGIRPQARLTAKEAARRSGLSVGEWLNSVIIESAIEEGVRPGGRRPIYEDDLDVVGDEFERRLPLDDDDAALAAVNERLEGLTRQLQHLARLGAAPEPSRSTAKDEEDSQRVAHAIERLERRLDQLIAKGSSETERRTAAVDRAAAALGAADDDPSGLDRAVAEISARQRALDANPSGPSGFDRPQSGGAALSQGLEQQLRRLTSQIETLRQDDAISDLRADLLDIRRTLTEAMPRHALTSLENDVRALADRLLETRQITGDDATLAGLEEKIVEVRDAVRALTPAESLVGVDDAVKSLAQKIEFIAANDQDPSTLHQLGEATAALRGMTSRVASNDALAELTRQVQDLAAKIDNLATGDVLATLDERISMLADALQRHNGASMSPQFDAVLKSVNDKLERLQVKGGDNADLGAMEDRLGKLLERIEAGRPGNAPAADPGIEALKDDIAEIKRNRSDTDRRIEESLEALNGTLGNVVDRLALIETDLRGRGSSQGPLHGGDLASQGAPQGRSSVPPMQPLPPMQPVPPTQPVPPSASPPAPNYAAAVAKLPPLPPSAPPPKCEPIDPNLPPDHPLEPGSRGRAAPTPADRMAGSKAAAPPVIPDPGGKSDFIAAARRAAQAAGAASSRTPSRTVADNTEAEGKGKRSLLVAICAVIILLGTLHVGANLLGLYNATPKAPASVHAPAIETEPAAEGDTSPPPAPNRQSGLIFMPAPSLGITVRDPASPPRKAITSKPEYTGALPLPLPPEPASPPRPAPKLDSSGSVQIPVVPAATPEYAALPEAPVLPTAIGGPALRTAAINGDAAAAYEIAARYVEGRGVPQNYQEAAGWFERATKGGLAPAQFRLGSLYEKGLGVKKDLQMARQLYTAAGEKGNAKAMHNLAVLYAEGIDGKPDYDTAAQWFRKAADRGIGDSQYNLGILYARGIGVEQNLPESYKWFTLAALAGDKESAKKRDDVAGRLDAQALMAARLAAQTWAADPQPEEATTVKAPAGGWEQADSRPAKPKPAARPKTSSSVGSSREAIRP